MLRPQTGALEHCRGRSPPGACRKSRRKGFDQLRGFEPQDNSPKIRTRWSRFSPLIGSAFVRIRSGREGMLSVLVCHKVGDNLPGSGFFSLAKELGRDVSDRIKCWSDETNLVYRAFE